MSGTRRSSWLIARLLQQRAFAAGPIKSPTSMRRSESSTRDEVTPTLTRAVKFVRQYLGTVRAAYTEPEVLFFTERGAFQPMPPLKFFATSFLCVGALETYLLPIKPATLLELPDALSRLKAVLEHIPLTIPLMAAAGLFLAAIGPWLVLRPFKKDATLGRMLHAYCYQQGALLFPAYAALMLVFSFMTLAPAGPGSWTMAWRIVPIVWLVVTLFSYKWLLRAVRTITETGVFVAAVAVVLPAIMFGWAIDSWGPMTDYRVPSVSMSPTVNPGDRIIVNRWIYSFRPPAKGEIVAYYPGGPPTIYVFRVVGTAGDTVEMLDGALSINGVAVPRKPVEAVVIESASHRVFTESLNGREYSIALQDSFPRPNASAVVPEGHIYVLGDNRDNANDSRATGAVPLDAVVGHVYFKAVPFSEAGRL